MSFLSTYDIESYQYSTVWNLPHPVLIQHTSVFNCKYKTFSDRKPHQIPPLGIRVASDQHTVGFKKKTTLQYAIPATPPWLLKWPIINVSLHHFHNDTAQEIYKSKFLWDMQSIYRGYSHFYTDGSRIDDRAALAVVYNDTIETTHLPDGHAFTVLKVNIYHFLRLDMQPWSN